MILRFVFLAVLLSLPSIASACAVCDSEIGIAVRAGLFNGSFFPTLLEVFAPFPVFGLAIYAISRYLPD
ncbi:MAG TPA: hypothetical protein VFQ83_04170 [Candidatus Udaeobacter sp.]|jgi:hypothetical protein|nr:hypothetical protein [Candidatus Udaeobacter sp.]